jgi:DNA polymerase-3 subunit gamma/tau
MSYQVLARKWRPKSFEKLVGQAHVVQALVNGLEHDRVHHAFLFTGTRGVGKTTLARILAKCLNCEQGVTAKPCNECRSCIDIDEGRFVDMLEIDAASRTKVEDTRDMLNNVQYAPTCGRFKVYIIDEVHMLSEKSFNALLKTLEEPPPHVKFVLATTEVHKIPVTILSRCLRFNLKQLLPGEIRDYLQSILEEDGIEYDVEALLQIARAADGSMRDGLSLLDQAIAYGAGQVRSEEVRTMLGSIEQGHVLQILGALREGSAKSILKIVDELASLASDFDRLLQQLAENLHQVVLLQQVPDYRDESRADWEFLSEFASTISSEDAQLFYQIALLGRRDLQLAPDPRSGAEMTLLRMLAFRPADSVPQDSGSTGQAVKQENSDGATRTAAVKTAAPPAEQEIVHEAQQMALPDVEPTRAEPAAKRPDKPLQAVDQPPDPELSWNQVLEKLELRGAAKELARNVELTGRENETWHFAIPRQLIHLGSGKLTSQLEQALGVYSGQSASVIIHASEQQIESPAGLEESKLNKKLSEAEQSIHQDPTVQALSSEMGAKVVAGSIEPVQ